MQCLKNKVLHGFLIGVFSLVVGSQASAQQWPFMGSDYWEVTSIQIKDGGGWKYANWLATEWKKNSEFAKSKGWIKDYMILSNVHARKGEPDLYIIRVRADIPDAAEGEKRQKEYMEWNKKSTEEMVDASGNRAEYREVQGSSLLQVLEFR